MRRDGIGVDIYHVVTCRVAPDLIGAQMMGVRRSTAFGLDPRRDRLAVVQRTCVCAVLGKRESPAASAMMLPTALSLGLAIPRKQFTQASGLAHSSALSTQSLGSLLTRIMAALCAVSQRKAV
jgi:hypothetical protein